MKEEILRLRAIGKSYKEISEITGASKGTIAYHCSDSVKKKYHHRASKGRREFKDELKLKHGGKCKKCGYAKCLAALEFHHVSDNKIESVSNILRSFGQQKAEEEALKCELLCANCHRELHDDYGLMQKAAGLPCTQIVGERYPIGPPVMSLTRRAFARRLEVMPK